MPMGPMRRPLRNCRTTGSSLVSSTSRGPNITRCLRNSMPMLSGTVRAMLMLCVTIRIVASICALMSISSWRQVGGTDRVQTGVGLVAEDDLRVEHQRAGQAGALAHTAGDLAGELVLVAGQTDQLELLHDDVADLAFLLLRVLTQAGKRCCRRGSSSRTARRPGTSRRTACGSRRAPWPSTR